MMMYRFGHYGAWPGPAFGFFPSILPIVGILVVVFILAAIFSAKNHEESNKDDSETTETPLTILKKRYAKGEITKHQFEEMKKDVG